MHGGLCLPQGRARLCRSSFCSPLWGAWRGLADPSSGDEPTEPLGAAGTKLGQLQNLLVTPKVRQSFLSKGRVTLQTSKVFSTLKYGNCLLALAPCNLGGKLWESSMCPAHFQRENEHFEKMNLRDAVGSLALSCSWESMT